MRTTDPQDEIFPIVNEKDEVIGKITRKEANRSPHIIHRAVDILLFDQKGRLLIQKRSLTKDTSPGCWCVSASGHVEYGEDYESVAIRETKEELGLTISSSDLLLLGKILVVAPWEKEMTQVYRVNLQKEVAFRPNPVEVTELRFVSLKTLREMLTSQPFTPSLKQVLKRFIVESTQA